MYTSQVSLVCFCVIFGSTQVLPATVTSHQCTRSSSSVSVVCTSCCLSHCSQQNHSTYYYVRKAYCFVHRVHVTCLVNWLLDGLFGVRYMICDGHVYKLQCSETLALGEGTHPLILVGHLVSIACTVCAYSGRRIGLVPRPLHGEPSRVS